MDDRERAMRRAAELGLEFLAGLGERHVGALTDDATLVARLGGPLPDDGQDPALVVEEMARAFDPGLVASAGPRYFGFVIGGQLPAAADADASVQAILRCARGHEKAGRSLAPFPAVAAVVSRRRSAR